VKSFWAVPGSCWDWKSRGWLANDADWQRLLELCALYDCLVGDEDGVYDPTDFNDRLLLA